MQYACKIERCHFTGSFIFLRLLAWKCQFKCSLPVIIVTKKRTWRGWERSGPVRWTSAENTWTNSCRKSWTKKVSQTEKERKKCCTSYFSTRDSKTFYHTSSYPPYAWRTRYLVTAAVVSGAIVSTMVSILHAEKTEADVEREKSLIDQWVCLTEERNAVLVPAAGTGIPGAPADWTPPSGMEQHIPVIFLDLNGESRTTLSTVSIAVLTKKRHWEFRCLLSETHLGHFVSGTYETNGQRIVFSGSQSGGVLWCADSTWCFPWTFVCEVDLHFSFTLRQLMSCFAADDMSTPNVKEGMQASGVNSILPKEHGAKFYTLPFVKNSEKDVSDVFIFSFRFVRFHPSSSGVFPLPERTAMTVNACPDEMSSSSFRAMVSTFELSNSVSSVPLCRCARWCRGIPPFTTRCIWIGSLRTTSGFIS